MSAPKKLDTQTETQVVAMIARGDTQQTIVDWILDNKGIELSIKTVGLIKSRNKEALSFMKSKLVEHETTMATSILQKSRQLIDKRLDHALSLDERLRSLKTKFENGDIDDKEYYHQVDVEMRNRLSVQELNSLSKESFNQSQLEANKPTSITDNPAQAKKNLETLLTAIAGNDQAAALKAMFPDD